MDLSSAVTSLITPLSKGQIAVPARPGTADQIEIRYQNILELYSVYYYTIYTFNYTLQYNYTPYTLYICSHYYPFVTMGGACIKDGSDDTDFPNVQAETKINCCIKNARQDSFYRKCTPRVEYNRQEPNHDKVTSLSISTDSIGYLPSNEPALECCHRHSSTASIPEAVSRPDSTPEPTHQKGKALSAFDFGDPFPELRNTSWGIHVRHNADNEKAPSKDKYTSYYWTPKHWEEPNSARIWSDI